MSEKTNTEKLKDYLNNFLLNDRNNGKIVMLSGAWGAGKTHFWKEEIAKEQEKIEKDNKEIDKYSKEEYKTGLHSKLKDKNKACVYISLYGKTSIESIELDIFMKAYKHIVGDADIVSKTCSVFTNLGKNLGNIAYKGAGNAFTWLDNLIDKDKFNKAGEYLENGGIICFDDFERKSKNIDLNDLFGFISQLALEYKCKIVIILNSDVFQEEEAKVFSNVKEKTINKFLTFNPSKEELFEIIFSLYQIDEKYKEVLLKSILEMDILNARVYKNVFENFEELIEEYPDLTDSEIRFFVLSLINFNLTHRVFKFYDYPKGFETLELPKNFIFYKITPILFDSLKQILDYKNKIFIKSNLIKRIQSLIEFRYANNQNNNIHIAGITTKPPKEIIINDINALNKYSDDIWNYWKLDKILNFRENVSLEKQKVINDFIEKGYL